MHASPVVIGIAAMAAVSASPDKTPRYQLDPFEQASTGYPACPATRPPYLDARQMALDAHQRIERGTSCCLSHTCECGGAYQHDREINQRVVAAIRGDSALNSSSVWVSTSRQFVTLTGCVRSARQKRLLEARVAAQQGVKLVWNEVSVGLPPSPAPAR